MIDVVIVGGGIVGLATAWQLKCKSPKLSIAVLEKENGPAKHQTGNNSGVIHSGLYYKPCSLKATNCIKGYNMIVDFCQKESIDFDLCGKVVVATDEKEIPYLDTLMQRGQANGLENLQWLNKEQIKEHEPHVEGVKGIFVPQTGIVDYEQVCFRLVQKLTSNGVEIKYGHKVESVVKHSKSATISTTKDDFEARLIVNCAGLYSDKVAKMTTEENDLKIIPFRGEYYQLKKDSEHLVKNLIYPVPDPNFPFLGVHFTRMIGGGVEAGPNAVLAFQREGYKKTDVNIKELMETFAWPGFQKVVLKYWKTGLGEMYRSFSKAAFTNALQKLIPEIKSSDLEAGGAGVRAQACDRNGGLLDDFYIVEDELSINVCNAPSPAATSSLAIGDEISDKIIAKF